MSALRKRMAVWLGLVTPDVNPNTVYDIALRPDGDGLLDDVVVNRVGMFRAERMDDKTLWLACYLDNGEDVVFFVSSSRSGLRFTCTEAPSMDAVRYESEDDAKVCLDGRR